MRGRLEVGTSPRQLTRINLAHDRFLQHSGQDALMRRLHRTSTLSVVARGCRWTLDSIGLSSSLAAAAPGVGVLFFLVVKTTKYCSSPKFLAFFNNRSCTRRNEESSHDQKLHPRDGGRVRRGMRDNVECWTLPSCWKSSDPVVRVAKRSLGVEAVGALANLPPEGEVRLRIIRIQRGGLRG